MKQRGGGPTMRNYRTVVGLLAGLIIALLVLIVVLWPASVWPASNPLVGRWESLGGCGLVLHRDSSFTTGEEGTWSMLKGKEVSGTWEVHQVTNTKGRLSLQATRVGDQSLEEYVRNTTPRDTVDVRFVMPREERIKYELLEWKVTWLYELSDEDRKLELELEGGNILRRDGPLVLYRQ